MKYIVIILSLLMISCQAPIKKINADAWLIDSVDGTLYRVLNNGFEEYLVIIGNRQAEDFMCFHKDQIKEHIKESLKDEE